MPSLLSAPTAPPEPVNSPFDLLGAELGADLARVERELRQELRAALAEVRQELETARRQMAEIELRAVNAERARDDLLRERLAAVRDGESVSVDDVRPVVESQIARHFEAWAVTMPTPDAIAERAAALVEVPELPDVPALVNGTVADAVAAIELPDIAAMVSAESEKHIDDIVLRAAALIDVPKLPEIPDVQGLVDNAVAAAFVTLQLPEMPDVRAVVAEEFTQREDEVVERVAALIKVPELPDVPALVDKSVADAVAAIELPDVAGMFVEAANKLSDEFRQRDQEIAERAAVLVKIPDPPVLPDIPRMVDRALADAVAAIEWPDFAVVAAAEIAKREDDIALKAAELVRLPDPPELPDISAMVGARVDHAVAAAFATVPVPRNGVDADPEVAAAMVRAETAKAYADLRAEFITPADAQEIARAEIASMSLDQPAPLTMDDVQRAIDIEGAKLLSEVGPLFDVSLEVAKESLIPEIAQRAAELVPQREPVEIPDVAAAVAEEFDLRREEFVSDVAKLVPTPDIQLPDITGVVDASVSRAIADLPKPQDGHTPTEEELTSLVERIIERVIADLPAPEPGHTPTADEIRPLVIEELTARIADIPMPEPGPPGPPGKLPVVKAWKDGVHYEADVVTHAGATWQALRDTGREPPSEDWICLARAGYDGVDGRSLQVRGTYTENGDYQALDVVALNGGSFIARCDNPGPCPGERWQLLTKQGKQGPQGLRGEPGPRGLQGPPGPAVRTVSVNNEGVQTFTNADGSTVSCDFYPLLERLGQ